LTQLLINKDQDTLPGDEENHDLVTEKNAAEEHLRDVEDGPVSFLLPPVRVLHHEPVFEEAQLAADVCVVYIVFETQDHGEEQDVEDGDGHVD